MIPKVIFQTSITKQPNYVLEQIKSNSEGWDYKHFNDEDIIQFMIDNPIEEFSNIIDIFNSIIRGAHKADLFRYYYLYLKGGVFIDSDAMIEININDIVKDYSFFTVKSGLINIPHLFNGFIGAEPYHIIIYKALQHIYKININALNSDYFIVCKKLYDIVFNNSDSNLTKYKIYKERIPNSTFSEIINDNNVIIMKHYYNYKIITPLMPPIMKERNARPANDIKIGITFLMPQKSINLFSSGIQQNVLYFTELLLNIGYDVYLIIPDNIIYDKSEINKMLYDKRIKTIKKSDILYTNFDIVFIFGYLLEINIIQELKTMKTKIVIYSCGNNFLVDSENILFNLKRPEFMNLIYTTPNITEQFIDEIWTIPQMYNTNKYYWEIMNRCKCIEIPFIWSNKSIEISKSIESLNITTYVNRGSIKKIIIFEPNVNIMKSSMAPLLICEKNYRTNNLLIGKVFVTNINESINVNLTEFTKSFDLRRDNKLSFESRYNALYLMSTNADIVVSHQWENNLNYLWLEMAWMGWPVIHNGSLCKDVGYYYEGFDYQMGSDMLTDVLLNHDKNADKYMVRNRQIIDRYLPTNIELQNTYKDLINNLLN